MEDSDNKRKLLVVDDVEINRMILTELFNEEFDVLEADNGRITIDYLEKYGAEISCVLLDLVMPVMDGFEVLRNMHRTGIIQTVPVIMITGENDDEIILEGYNLGVADLVSKPFVNDIIYRRVNNVVELYANKLNLERKLAEQKSILEKQTARINQANQFFIDALSTTVEFRNFETGTHVKRIRFITNFFLEYMNKDLGLGLSPEKIEIISNASAVHDIGKIAIPDAILLKAGPLTADERKIMESHTIQGCAILSTLDYMQDTEYYKYCYEICRYHHERWDGKGYPDKLVGDQIPIWAQATSLADVYDALTTKRVYKDAYTHNEAINMIVHGECGTFNPKIIEVLLETKEMLYEKIHIL